MDFAVSVDQRKRKRKNKLILESCQKKKTNFGVVWFYGIPNIVGYLMPN